MLLVDFMVMLSDPGGFSKGADKRDEAMKGMGIEATDTKAEQKKKKEEQAKKGHFLNLSKFIFNSPKFLFKFN